MKKFILPILATALLATACVEDKMYEGPSKIDSVTLSPDAPTSNDEVYVSVTTSGLQALSSAELKYNGTTIPMTVSGNQANAKIPALPDKTVVNIDITVTNTAGFKTSISKGYTVGNPSTDWTKLVLNELYGAGADNEKFIELYNNFDFDIDLSGATLFKDGGETAVWTGLKGEVVPAHGVFAIVGAKGTTERGISSGFSSKKSVLIQLFDPNGNLIDTFQRGTDEQPWGDQKLDDNKGSWSRVPDGTGKFMITSEITVGALNAKEGTEDPALVQ